MGTTFVDPHSGVLALIPHCESHPHSLPPQMGNESSVLDRMKYRRSSATKLDQIIVVRSNTELAIFDPEKDENLQKLKAVTCSLHSFSVDPPPIPHHQVLSESRRLGPGGEGRLRDLHGPRLPAAAGGAGPGGRVLARPGQVRRPRAGGDQPGDQIRPYSPISRPTNCRPTAS